jgi:hypothetical protein
MHVTLERSERRGDQRTLVLAQRQEGRENDDLAVQRGERDRLAMLVDEFDVLRRGPVEGEPLVGRRRRGRGGTAGGQEDAKREEDGSEGAAR